MLVALLLLLFVCFVLLPFAKPRLLCENLGFDLSGRQAL